MTHRVWIPDTQPLDARSALAHVLLEMGEYASDRSGLMRKAARRHAKEGGLEKGSEAWKTHMRDGMHAKGHTSYDPDRKGGGGKKSEGGTSKPKAPKKAKPLANPPAVYTPPKPPPAAAPVSTPPPAPAPKIASGRLSKVRDFLRRNKGKVGLAGAGVLAAGTGAALLARRNRNT